MHYILLLMLLGSDWAMATTTEPAVPEYSIPLCQAIDTELQSAVDVGIIDKQQAALISVRCWTYHSHL